MLRMSESDVLPFDYEQYGREVGAFFASAQKRSQDAGLNEQIDFAPAIRAAQRFEAAGKTLQSALQTIPQNAPAVNSAFVKAERALLTDGLPHRPFFRHAIFAPGEYTGYAAVVIPGVNEAIDQKDTARLRDQLKAATGAVERAAQVLESAR
jgi:N-acetylated-alpha-linked acidic dipeptidase